MPTTSLMTWGCNINHALGRAPYGRAQLAMPEQVVTANNPVLVSCGLAATAFVTKTRKCYVVGRALDRRNAVTFGRLAAAAPTLAEIWMRYGRGSGSVDFPTPTLVDNVGDTADVKCSAGWVLGLSTDGIAWSFGNNLHKQTGTEFTSASFVPSPSQVMVPDNERISKIAAGYQHGLALTRDGNVIFWGTWSKDQQDHIAEPMPVRIPLPSKAIDVACGFASCAVVTSDGALYVWGKEQSNELQHNGRYGIATHPRLVTNIPPLSSVHCTQFATWGRTMVGDELFLACGTLLHRTADTPSRRISKPVQMASGLSSSTTVHAGYTSIYLVNHADGGAGVQCVFGIEPPPSLPGKIIAIDEGWRHFAVIVQQ